MSLTPKNWASFQHYQRRRSKTARLPWIKLHHKLLDNFDFACLPVASRALAPMLWLLASEYDDGVIKLGSDAIAFRLRMAELDFTAALEPLVKCGFFEERKHDDSSLLADGLQTATLERRRKKEERRKPPIPPQGDEGSQAFEQFWQAYPQRQGANPKFTARKAFDQATRDTPAETIIAAAKSYATKPSTKVGTSFVAQAATWLNQRRWQDEARPAAPTSITGPGTVMLPDGRIRSSRYPRSEAAWRELVATWATARTWPDYAGPDPGSSLCECPRDLLTPPAQIIPSPPPIAAPRPNGNGAHQHHDPADYDHAPPPPRTARKPPSPDEQRVLLDGYLSGTLALDGPPPGRPGSLISPEIARERGL